jgi:hypothetical protein
MSLMQAPVGIMLLHRTMVEEEQDRRRHPRLANGPLRRQTPLMTIRTLIGRILIAAGTRLDPTAHPERHDPAMGALSIAR